MKKPTARRAYRRRQPTQQRMVAIADPTDKQIDLAKWILTSHLNGKIVKQPPRARRAAEDVLLRAMRPRIRDDIVVSQPYTYTTAALGSAIVGHNSAMMLRNAASQDYGADKIATVGSTSKT